MSGMAVRRSGRMSRPLSTGRGTENSYLPNNGMLATSSSLALAANVLGFEIMELWVCHGDSDDNLKCIFVHASEELMKANPGIIAGHFPQHKKKHTISPRLCKLARESSTRCFWTTDAIDRVVDGDNESQGTVFETEFAYLLEEVKNPNVQVFIVGFACEKIAFKKSKIKFLSGLGYAIYVAAFSLDEDEGVSSEEEDDEETKKKEQSSDDLAEGQQGVKDDNVVNEAHRRKKSAERLESCDATSSLDAKTFVPRPLHSLTPHPSSNNLIIGGSVSSGSIRGSDGFVEEDDDIEQLVRKISERNLMESGLGSGVWKERESLDSEAPGPPSRDSEKDKAEASSITISKDVAALSVSTAAVVEREGGGVGVGVVDGYSCHSVPTWDPIDSFSYPVANIPPKSRIPNNMTLDCFSEVKHIADGSNSNIFLVKWKGETVVIKMIKKQVQADPIAVHEFDVEHGILTRLSHPRIIKLLGSGWQPRRFLVLEYMGGGSLNALMTPNQTSSGGLAQRLFRRPTFTYAMLLQRAKEIAEALEYLHSKFHEGATIIHRDLKPDNIGFTTSGELKLFDFGLCTCVKTRNDVHEAYEMTGNTGSLRYMAPEVALRKPYTEKADVFSFGIMVWQMARDRIPFKGVTRDEFFSQVIYKGQRPKLDKSWPSGFSTLLTDCWDKDPRLRPSFDKIVMRLNMLIDALGPKIPKPLMSPAFSYGKSSDASREQQQQHQHDTSKAVTTTQPTPVKTLHPASKTEARSSWF